MRPGPLPELLVSRRDRPGAVRWSVEPGAARRGEAWTDVVGCAMRVPFEGGAHGRVVRAHELMHARVSPLTPSMLEAFEDLEPRAVECAEEFRVNHLLGRVGFDLRELRDGSERLTGQRLADAGEWVELAHFAAAVSGTRALADLVTGVRRIAPAWATACRAVERELLRAARRVATSSLASTSWGHSPLPDGFAQHTRSFATIVARHAAAPATMQRTRPRRRGARPAATGCFAPLVLDEGVVLDRVVRGAITPRRVAASTGRRVVRPQRLVTDPQRRVFERHTRRRGGVVVVDQSGSMSLSEVQLGELLDAAPGAFVLGYSHAPGATGLPNAWVLAERGRAASTVPAGNVGNGVDGPALRLALSKRRAREWVVWVCDGQVTDSGDHADPALAAECARLVVRHGIKMVPTVDEALRALRARGTGVRRGRALGRVGAAVTAGS
jgi:hypothetical protein